MGDAELGGAGGEGQDVGVRGVRYDEGGVQVVELRERLDDGEQAAGGGHRAAVDEERDFGGQTAGLTDAGLPPGAGLVRRGVEGHHRGDRQGVALAELLGVGVGDGDDAVGQ